MDKMKAAPVIFLCIVGAVTATTVGVKSGSLDKEVTLLNIHRRDKRQARWGRTPTATWAPTTIGTQGNFGGQNWGNTQPTPVRFPSMFNNMARSRNSIQAPSTSRRLPSSTPAPKPSQWTRSASHNHPNGKSNRSKSVGSSRPGRRNPAAGQGSPAGRAQTAPIPTYPPTMPPRPVRRPKPRRNRLTSQRSQSNARAPASNFGMANMIPPSFLQGLGRAMADKLRSMWINPLYQRQAKAAGDNFVVNPNPVNIGYHGCPPSIVADRCVYNPCPRCRNPLIECWTNPCGGCTGDMYLRGRRIHDCETI